MTKNIKKENKFLCDSCGKEKHGKKYIIYDENWNKQKGLYECESCFSEKINKNK